MNSFHFDAARAETAVFDMAIEFAMDDIDRAWSALRDRLESRAREMAQTPLPACAGERSRVIELARFIRQIERERPSLPAPAWHARLTQIAWTLFPHDEEAAALHTALVEALRERCVPREA